MTRSYLAIFVVLAALTGMMSRGVARDEHETPRASLVGGSAFVLPASESPEWASIKLPDPFPIRREFISSTRLETILADTAKGQLRQLPQREFELLVRAAALEKVASENPPKIVEAHYHATWASSRLTGTATWKLVNTTRLPAAVSLEPLQLAMSLPKWQDDRPAKVFRAVPRNKKISELFLWADDPAGGQIECKWSVRGIEEPDEERFELAVPPTPIAHLELTIPADRLPSCSFPTVVITGPFPAENTNERLWRLSFGGLSKIPLAIRRPLANVGTPAVRMTKSVRYALAPGEVRSTFELQLESAREPLREQTFQVDPALTVVEVIGDLKESWHFTPAPNNQSPGLLRVVIRDPSSSVRLTVRARSTLAFQTSSWNCPTIRTVHQLPGDETIEFLIHPEFKIEGWNANEFRSTLSQTLSDQTQRIVYESTLATSGNDERRLPVLRFKLTEPEFRTEESLIWKLEPGRNRFEARTQIQVLRGPAATFTFRTISGYVVEAVDTTPDDPGVSFRPTPGVQNSWIIEPSRAIGTGQNWGVRVQLRGPDALTIQDPATTPEIQRLPLPYWTLAGAIERNGTYLVQPRQARVSIAAATPMISTAQDITWNYKGREPTGDLLFTPNSISVNSNAKSTVSIQGKNWSIASDFLVTTEEPIQSLTLFVPGNAADVVCDEPSAKVTRVSGSTVIPFLPFLDAAGPWPTLGIASILSRKPGEFWRITFPNQLRGQTALHVRSQQLLESGAGVGSIALPTIGGTQLDASTIQLDPQAADQIELLDSEPRASSSRVRYRPRDARTPATSDQRPWRFEQLRIVNTIEHDGSCRSHLSGRIAERRGNQFNLVLPQLADLETVKIDDKYLAIDSPRDGRIAIPAPNDQSYFEVVYRLPASRDWPIAAHPVVLPEFPGEPTTIELIWHCAGSHQFWPKLEYHLSGGIGNAEVRVVSHEFLMACSLIFALLLAGVLFSVAYAPTRRGIAATALLLATLGCVILLAPQGWSTILRPSFFVLGITILAWTVTAAARRSPAMAFCIAIPLATGQAQAPEPAKVFVVQNTTEAAEQYSVFAPATVVKRLETLSRSGLPSVALLSAEYEGKANDELVAFTTTYTLSCNRAGTHTFALPLAGVLLASAKLDGEDAFLDATRPDQFSLKISGTGQHQLVLKFTVASSGTAADREVRFTMPDLAASRLSLSAGSRARQLEVPTRRGSQILRLLESGPKVDVEHGGGTEMVVRWREGIADGVKANVAVREACVWDLSESEARLTAAFVYSIEGGTLAQLKLLLPDSLEPIRLNVRSLDPRSGGIGVRDWRVGAPENGQRTIDVRLQSPTDGRFVVVLSAAMLKPLTMRPNLFFPRADAINDSESFYAIRYSQLVADTTNLLGVIDFPAEAMTKEFSIVPELGFEKQPPARVVRRVPVGTAELRPVLVPPCPIQNISAEMQFELGRQINIEGSIRATGKEIGIVEFEVPPAIRIHELRASGLAGWHRSGARVQVWLQTPVTESTMRWSGSLPLDLAPKGEVPYAPVPLDLPLARYLSMPGCQIEPLIVRMKPAENWTIAMLPQSTNLKLKPLQPGDDTTWMLEGNPQQALKIAAIWQPKTKPTPILNPQKPDLSSESPSINAPGNIRNVMPKSQSIPVPEQSSLRQRASIAIAWAVAFLLAGLLVVRIGTRLWPEQVVLWCGLFTLVLGVSTNVAVLFYFIAILAISVRVFRITLWLWTKRA